MTKLRQIFLISLSVGLMLSLSGCDAALLQPHGWVAGQEKKLLIDAVELMSLIVVPTMILTIIFAIRYRASNEKATYKPDWSHSVAIEVVCWTLPILIIGVLAAMTWKTSHTLDPYKPLDKAMGKPMTIQVVSLNWRWLFIYPDQKIATMNFVEFPDHVPVRFLITADSPMNSFQIPQLGSQIYVMGGMQTQVNLIASKRGDYAGQATNFTGQGFANMNFKTRVVSQKEFNAWVDTVQDSPDALTKAEYKQIAQPSEDNSVKYYSSVSDKLFDDVMMKYMMPGK